MKNYRFSRRWFFIDNHFDMRDMKMKMTISCSPRRGDSEHVLFTLKTQFQNLTSGQVQVRSWPKYANMHIFRRSLTSKVAWHHLRVSISILSRVIGEKRIAASCDLRWSSRDPRSSTARGSSQKGWVAMIPKELGGFGWFIETGSNFIFPHRIIMGRSRNWPDLRSPG